ncbi:hypothetical protein HAX54_028481, partial [Datura stramonium]|nr:hypothetical protein [Datura stramonium]
IYLKREDSIVKKANELAILCDTDVALLMFTPNGQVTGYSSERKAHEEKLNKLNQTLSEAREERFNENNDFFLGAAGITNLSGEYRSKPKSFYMPIVPYEFYGTDTTIKNYLEESPSSVFSRTVCRNQQGMNVVRKAVDLMEH